MRVCPSCFALYGPETMHCPKDGASTADSVDVLVGSSLGSYQVRALIGEGGMGVVYAGEHTTIGRRVALKVLRPELSLRDDIVERFVQEARAVNTISHGNIVNIYDFGKTPFGTFYIVMEYLDGKTVRALLDEEGPQPMDRVLSVVSGVGAALAAAHGKGFIHRDVKPENIMLVQRAGVTGIKLLDFGIAKLMTSQAGPTTHTGSALGTPQYMCPEQLEATSFDHRSDIYSLGAVTYEMLTGRLPYPGKSHAEVRQMQLTRTPPPPSVLRPAVGLSRRLDAAVLWALSTDPSTRCSRMEDFVAQLRAGFEDVAENPAPRRDHGRLLVLIAVVLVAMGAGGSLVYLLLPHGTTNGHPTRPTPDARPVVKKRLSTKKALVVAYRRVDRALTSSQAADRILAVELLDQMRRPMLTVREQLRHMLATDDQPAVLRHAALLLARMKDQTSIPPIRKRLALAQGVTACDYAEALAMLGDRGGLDRLHQELHKATALRRAPVLEALGRLGDPKARDGLRSIVDQMVKGSGKKYQIWGYLAQLGDTRARDTLARIANTNDWPARIKAAIALLPTRQEAALATLRQALDHTDGHDRLDAASHLAYFRDAIAAKVLLEFLDSGRDTAHRKDSAIALGHLEDASTLKALIMTLDDTSQTVSLAAAVGLLPRSAKAP